MSSLSQASHENRIAARHSRKQLETIERMLQDSLEEVLDDVGDGVGLSQMSMPDIDFSFTPAPTGSSTTIPTLTMPPVGMTTSPTFIQASTPTVPSSPTSSDFPSLAPARPSFVGTSTPTDSLSSIPSDFPSLAPSDIPTEGSTLDIVTSPPTILEDNITSVLPNLNTSIFECDFNGGIIQTFASEETGTTAIFLTVGYRAESTSNSSDAFISELERLLLETAVLAALGGCESNVRGLRRAAVSNDDKTLTHRSLFAESVEVVPCEASLNETESCTILETALIFYLKGEVDPDATVFASYSAIEDHMIRDKYIGIVPTVLLLEYLSPLPLPPPPSTTPDNGATPGDGTDENNFDPAVLGSTASADNLEVSPWTIGACVATVMGGIISLLVYSRNRNARQQRELQLVENRSSAVLESQGNRVSI